MCNAYKSSIHTIERKNELKEKEISFQGLRALFHSTVHMYSMCPGNKSQNMRLEKEYKREWLHGIHQKMSRAVPKKKNNRILLSPAKDDDTVTSTKDAIPKNPLLFLSHVNVLCLFLYFHVLWHPSSLAVYISNGYLRFYKCKRSFWIAARRMPSQEGLQEKEADRKGASYRGPQ